MRARRAWPRAFPPPPRPPRRPFEAALLADAGPAACRLIAEVKRRSPSAGSLREDLRPAELARAYVRAGAAAVSVLTEGRRFGGSLADLEQAATAVSVPVLRKDFLERERDVRESREAGAAAVLLIARRMDPARLQDLAACAREAGLETLVEVHALGELPAALACGVETVGVNNRDLETLRTDPEHALRVAAEARSRGLRWPRAAVCESGIVAREQVLAAAAAGFRAVLVGESLLRAADPAAAVRVLLGSA